MKFKKKLRIGIEVIKSKLFNKKIPLVVGWAITNRCNYKCKYCGRWKKKEKELSTQQVFSIIDELKQLGCKSVVFTGGEPLLREDIGLIVNYCKKNDLIVGINSNGSLFRKRINELKNIDSLTLSLDGPEKINDSLRVKGSYRNIVDAIKTAKSNKINVSLTTVVSGQNLEYLKNVLDTAKKYKIFVYFQPVSIVYNNKNIEEFKPFIEDYRKKIDELIDIKRKGNSYVGNSIPGLEHLRNWPNPKKIKCAFNIRLRIEPNGDIYTCGRVIEILEPQNFLKLGIREAFNRMTKLKCNYCWCAREVELNLAYSFKIKAIINILKTILN